MTITYVQFKTILLDKADVVVCPTNAVGAMGTGLAKRFRDHFRGLYPKYQNHCAKYDMIHLVPFVWPVPDKPQVVYCLHTKRHWRNDSSLEIIEDGLIKLMRWCEDHEVKSLAIPALGCGKGGLDFIGDGVKELMERYLKQSNMDVRVYIPYGID